MDMLQDWVLSSGCALHDAHNGFKWAMNPCASDMSKTLKNLFLVIQSLRSSYDGLVALLPSFLAKVVSFRPNHADPDVVYQVWCAFGVESDVAES